MSVEKVKLFLGFDSLRNDSLIETRPHADDRTDDNAVTLIAGDCLYK